MAYNISNIIGRDTEVKKLLRVLETHSIVLSSHRRMGKTYLLKKIKATHPDNIVPLFLIVEGKSSPEEFVYDLYRCLQEEGLITIGKSKRFHNWYEKTIAGQEIKEMKLPSFRPHWKEALRKIIEGLLEEQKGKTIVIMIDEFPIMLYKFIMEYKLVNEAVELIDTLREIRQVYGDRGIRFIFCGSIGINVVLEKLKKSHNYAGEPLNDMSMEILDAMNIGDAKKLVRHLIEVKEISIEPDNDNTIDELCKSVDSLPFYIDLIIKEIDVNQSIISPESIKNEVERLILAAGNQGQFNHYTDRISTYYEKDMGKISRKTLNWLSTKENFVDELEIFNMLAGQQKIEEDVVRGVLKKLFDDLYLDRKINRGKRFYKFKYNLLRKWWMVNFG
ncbi:MAG: hypothetical protein B6D64_08655 [Bacteroidetes bacterium 4484_276]|nr:MAG: hypothetical protein B6D64_08655 [Bacteroidetes bacterium 4484_276]OYT14069.1 MAG: hypothetical protein B6I19_01840 [Bacteroidetes bacterium 4572_114]